MPVRLDKCFDENRIKYPNGERFGQIIPDTTNDLFIAAARSPRFREVYVAAYRAKIEEEECLQFAAVTFISPTTVYTAHSAERTTRLWDGGRTSTSASLIPSAHRL